MCIIPILWPFNLYFLGFGMKLRDGSISYYFIGPSTGDAILNPMTKTGLLWLSFKTPSHVCLTKKLNLAAGMSTAKSGLQILPWKHPGLIMSGG
jgi:hypothetical protein